MTTAELRQSAPSWVADAVIYQIYPASFADSTGDGVGDIGGIVDRLDYLQWLGVDVVWLNPCFASPMRDGGYDVSDFLSVAPRYGTNDDVARLCVEAGRRNIRVLLDLVPGHTSDQHPMFVASADGEDVGADRYIWSPHPVEGFEQGPGERRGWYRPNFFTHQPALNYGYARPDSSQPWRQLIGDPGPQANRQMLRAVMAHWLDLGVSGFRVDMPLSLVKDDPGFVETGRLWAEMRNWIDDNYPGAVLFAEGGRPDVTLPAGFHGDFFLHVGNRTLMSLWNNGEGVWPADHACYFHRAGTGSIEPFLADWRSSNSGGTGYAILPTSNHDFSRLATGSRTGEQLKVAMMFVLTWPSVPVIYYGDEIGMRHVPQTRDHEGSVNPGGHNRAASRTPMQWSEGASAGFSSAHPEDLYLPIDPDAKRPTVAGTSSDPRSLLHLVKDLIALRRDHRALSTAGTVEVHYAGYPLVYERRDDNERFLVVLNPTEHHQSIRLLDDSPSHDVLGQGVRLKDAQLEAEPFAHAILRAQPGADHRTSDLERPAGRPEIRSRPLATSVSPSAQL